MYMHTLQDFLLTGYKQSFDNARSIAFFERTSSTHLIEDETVNDSGIINNLVDYEDRQVPDSLRVDKIYAEIQLSNKSEKHFLKMLNQFRKEFEIPIRASIMHIRLS
ncbi:uncharacterized protein TNCV_868401 [Trichonephila clavipes]|nr:uncharacterized protein TNCV_868401 [Trichonephila clavipes]